MNSVAGVTSLLIYFTADRHPSFAALTRTGTLLLRWRARAGAGKSEEVADARPRR